MANGEMPHEASEARGEEAMMSFGSLEVGKKFVVPTDKKRGRKSWYWWILVKINPLSPAVGQKVSVCDKTGSHTWATKKVTCNAIRVCDGTLCHVSSPEKIIQVE